MPNTPLDSPPTPERNPDASALVEAMYREHYRRLVAPLIRIVGNFEAAEDVVQEVFAHALTVWSRDGSPDVPLAWLHRVAKNRAIDRIRKQTRWQNNEAQIAAEMTATLSATHDGRDDSLRLVFTCCHPSLSPEAQVALTLRTICGLTSEQVARAFLVKRETLQQRIVRARRKIDSAGIPYEVPGRDQLPERLSTVLRTIYLVFNEGYGASDGDALIRVQLCDEAIRLARMLTLLLPDAPSPKALLALMLLHHARRHARTDSDGNLVTLEVQDRSLYDTAMVNEALPLVESALRGRPLSGYAIEAAIAALHTRAATADDTDWAQIAGLYAVLKTLSPNQPVVELNAAVAVAMAGDIEAGLSRLQTLANDRRLDGYHWLPAARADLLRRSGRVLEAAAEYAAAVDLASNPVERRFLQQRLRDLHANDERATHKDPP